MSALRTIDQTQPPGSGATVAVPKSYQPEMDQLLLDGSPRVLEFPASAGSFGPGLLSQILVPPTANRYILGGSTYLNFDLTTTVATTSPSNDAVTYFSGGPTKSAAALIDRLQISAAGTTLVDINNYAIWHNLILTHASSQDYQQSANIMENAFGAIDIVTTGQSGTTRTTTLSISLPLAVGLLNTVKAFPLWAFNGPLVINIYWSSFARSIGVAGTNSVAATTTPSAFTGTFSGAGLSLRCLCVDVDPEYIMEQRRQMAGGKMLMFQYDQAMGLQTNAGSASINFGINTSSLLAVLGAQLMTSDTSQIAVAANEGVGTSFTGSWGYSMNETSSIRVFRDGTQMTSFPLMQAQRDDAFPVLQQALGVLFSTSNATLCQRVKSGSTLGNGYKNNALDYQSGTSSNFNFKPIWSLGASRGGSVFQPAGCMWGVASRKCSDDSISNQGVYCQQLQLTVDSGASSSGTHYIFYVFSSAVAIDAGGNCIVKR